MIADSAALAAADPTRVKLVVQLLGLSGGEQQEIICNDHPLTVLPSRIGETIRATFGKEELVGCVTDLLRATANEPAVVVMRCVADRSAPPVVLHDLPSGWVVGRRRIDRDRRGSSSDQRRPNLLLPTPE
ncbi:MAG: hypothetical protein V1826_02485 [bacterium]